MYNTKPTIIAPNEPNWIALILFQPKRWLRINNTEASTMRMMPKFCKKPFIILFYFSLSILTKCKETQLSPIVKINRKKSLQ